MSQLIGYRTGGTVHIVTNNQIGFTTVPAHAYSGLYCTDVAKAIQAPILHVNGDDPEAVVFCARMAPSSACTSPTDIVLDIVCYRRHGHNETRRAGLHPADHVRPHQARRGPRARCTPSGWRPRAASRPRRRRRCWTPSTRTLEEAFQAAQSFKPNKADWLEGHWSGLKAAGTGEDEEQLHDDGRAARHAARGRRRRWPACRRSFGVNPKIARQLEAKKQAIDERRGHRLGDRRGAGLRHAAAGRPPRPPVGRGRAARHLQPAPRRAGRPGNPGRIRAAEQHPRGPGALRGLQLPAVRVRRARLRIRLLAGRSAHAGAVGGAVRRLRQRRAGDHRPVHRQRPRRSGCACRAW